MAEELSLPSEYSYFQKVYYNQELGIMYDANKTGNNRQLTTEEAIKEVLDKKKKLDRDRVKKAEVAAAAALVELRKLAGMTQEELGDYFVEHGLPEGVSAYDALTSRPKLRGQTQAQRADYYNTQKEIARAYKELMESLTEAWFNSTGIPNVTAHQGDTWNLFTINNGTEKGATETHKAYITLTLDALQDLSQEKIAEVLDALQKSGFNGQIKFASIGGRALLSFDNIVMHGATEEDAKKALETITKVLGKESVEYSQFGVDKNGTSYTDNLANSVEERIKAKPSAEPKEPKEPKPTGGQQSHWFDNVELDDEGRVNVDALPDNNPIVTQILSHTSLGLRTKPVRRLLDGLMMAEQTGKINLNDASAI